MPTKSGDRPWPPLRWPNDGAGPRTRLSSLLLEALNIRDAAEITQVVYRDASPKLRIASVCPSVATAADSGDEVALRIFEEAGRGLGAMACAAVRKLTPPPSLTFSGVGGVFETGELLWKPYRGFVLTEYPHAQVVTPAFPTSRRRADAGIPQERNGILSGMAGASS